MLQRKRKRNLAGTIVHTASCVMCKVHVRKNKIPPRAPQQYTEHNNPSHRAGLWFYPRRGWASEKVVAFCSNGGRDSEMGKQELTFTPSDFLFSRLLAAVERSTSRSDFGFKTILSLPTSPKTVQDFRRTTILLFPFNGKRPRTQGESTHPDSRRSPILSIVHLFRQKCSHFHLLRKTKSEIRLSSSSISILHTVTSSRSYRRGKAKEICRIFTTG